MPQPQYPTRCTALRTAALGVLSLLLLNVRTFTADAALAPAKPAPLRLGCATYGQRALSVDDLLTALRLPSVALYKAHLNWETATPDEVRAVLAKATAAGIAMTARASWRSRTTRPPAAKPSRMRRSRDSRR